MERDGEAEPDAEEEPEFPGGEEVEFDDYKDKKGGDDDGGEEGEESCGVVELWSFDVVGECLPGGDGFSVNGCGG